MISQNVYSPADSQLIVKHHLIPYIQQPGHFNHLNIRVVRYLNPQSFFLQKMLLNSTLYMERDQGCFPIWTYLVGFSVWLSELLLEEDDEDLFIGFDFSIEPDLFWLLVATGDLNDKQNKNYRGDLGNRPD